MGTDITLRDGTTALTVTDEFAEKYPAIAPDEELAELLAESLGDDTLGVNDFPRVRVPSGGVLQWAVTEKGEETFVKTLSGVLVFHKPQRVMWLEQEPSGKSPDCASNDGKRPIPGGLFAPDGERGDQNPTGLCANCPMSQPGSDPNPKNKGTWCKDQKLLFLVQPGKMFPVVVVVPPSSLREIKSYMISLINDRTPWWQAEVELTLEEAANAAGIKFARIKAKPVGLLEVAEGKAVKDYGDYLKAMVAQAAPGTFVEQPPVGTEGGLRMTSEEDEDE